MNTVPQNIKERKAGTDVRKTENAPATHKTNKPTGATVRKTNDVSGAYKTNVTAGTHKKNDAVTTHKSTASSQSNINKQLKRMSRSELVEVIYALEKDLETLQTENEQLRAELNDKYIRLNNAGSLAEAALSLNHIFEDAQAAADQYLYSLKKAAAGAINSTSVVNAPAKTNNIPTTTANTSAAVRANAAAVNTARAATAVNRATKTNNTPPTAANTSAATAANAATVNTSAASVAQRGRYAQ